MKQNITQYCIIKNHQVNLNGNHIFKADATLSASLFLKEIYKKFDFNYPKFYKMDSLCKLALISGSLVLDAANKIESDTAIILSNRSSCIDIDKKHQTTINEDVNGARPANFVYTLPNIALGEISIKYGLRSENSFFIFDDFNPQFLIAYSKSLIGLGKCKSILCGWVEINNDNYSCFVFLIEPKAGIELNRQNLLNLIEHGSTEKRIERKNN